MRLLAVFLILLSGPALALSCIEPSSERSYEAASKSPISYMVLLGEFAFDDQQLANIDGVENDPKPKRVVATFSGQALTKDGFRNVAPMQVALQQICAGPWCGGLLADEPVLTFVQRTPAGPVLELEPCPIWTLPPTEADTIQACFLEGGC